MAVIASTALLVTEHRNQQLDLLRTALSVVVDPLKYLVNAPTKLVQHASESVSSYVALKKENERLKTELSEAEAYIEELEEKDEKAKDKKFRMGDVNIGEFASVMLEGFVRRNPQLLTKLSLIHI